MNWINRTVSIFFTVLIVTSVAASGAVERSQSRVPSTLTEAEINEEMGDIVEIPIQVSPYDTTTLTISGEQYSTEVTATDRNGDGRIQIWLNTFEAQSPDTPSGYSVASPDHLREVTQHDSKGLATGEYTLTVGQNTSESTLALSAGEFQGSQTHSLPAGAVVNKTTVVERRSPVPNQIARGDILVGEFEAEGIMGVGRFDDPPGNNGIVPANSGLGEATAHTVQIEGENKGTSFQNIRVNYDSKTGGTPSGLIKLNITHAGIDSDGDGQIDRSFKSSITNINTNSQGIIDITVAERQNLSHSETLLLRYQNVTNPHKSGAYPATVLLGSNQTSTTVEYGSSANGNLGNGLDVTVTTTGSGEFVEPLPFKYFISPSSNRLYIAMNTEGLDDMSDEQIRLNLSKMSGVNNSTTEKLTANATLVEPTASILVSDRRWDANSESLEITGTTSLAPNTKIWIRIRSADNVPSPWIYHYSTSVQSNRTFELNITENRIRNDGLVYVDPVVRGGKIGPDKEVKVINTTADT